MSEGAGLGIRKHVLVIEPDAECRLDTLHAPLVAAGFRIETVRPHAGDAVRRDTRPDALVVLGGDMGASDDDEYPWLADVRALLAGCADAGVPTLGVCLGGQLLALACGGEVRRGEHGLEAGAVEVEWHEAAASDALVAGLPAPFTAGSWHRDAITALPAGATLLGSSGQYPHQAFRLGERAWGVQFHPEVSLRGFRLWSAHPEPGAERARIDSGIRSFERLHERVARHGTLLGEAFARVALG